MALKLLDTIEKINLTYFFNEYYSDYFIDRYILCGTINLKILLHLHLITKQNTWISFQVIVSLSYKPPWSWYCLRSSIGGCDPYVSSLGMFMSSMNIMILLPLGAPRWKNKQKILESKYICNKILQNWKRQNQYFNKLNVLLSINVTFQHWLKSIKSL